MNKALWLGFAISVLGCGSAGAASAVPAGGHSGPAARGETFTWETGAVADALPVDPRFRTVYTADGFRVITDRERARPGDRYVELLLVLDSDPGEQALQWRARLFDRATDGEVAETTQPVTARRTLLQVDMRRHALRDGRLRLALESRGRRAEAPAAVIECLVGADAAPPAPAAGERIRVMLDRPEGVDIPEPYPVTFGVPFPAGSFWDGDTIRLVDEQGREWPSQKEITARWSRDGAVRWLRIDAAVPTAGALYLERGTPAARPDQPVVVNEAGRQVTVRVAGAEYVLAPGASPIREIRRDGRLVARAGDTRGLYVVDQHGRTASAAGDNELRIESAGPLAASIRFEGFYRTKDGEPLARHITRIEFAAGNPSAAVTHTLVITEDTRKLWFRDIGWEWAVAPGAETHALFGLSPEDAGRHRKVPLGGDLAGATLFQRDHVQFGGGQRHFQLLGLRADGSEENLIEEGEAMGDWAALRGAAGGLLLSCREAARQHPKEIEAHADRMVLRLFSPRGGDELDFRTPAAVARWNRGGLIAEDEARGLEQIDISAAGWAKTHEILIRPLGPDSAEREMITAAALHGTPVYALVDPWWIYASRAMGPLYPRDPERFPAAEAFMAAAVEGYHAQGHERDGQYGFIDYFAGPHYRSALGSRRFGNTYTVRLSAWLHYARSGERSYRDFAAGTTRRFLDNHISHWDAGNKIRGTYHAGHNSYPLYWQGGAVSYKNRNLNQFLYDYYLTGYRRAGEVIEDYADGIQEWWEPGIRTWYRLRVLRDLWIAYAATWNSGLRVVIEDYMDRVYDPDGAVGVHREAIPNRTTYKANEDTDGIIEGWELHGDRRYYDLSRRLSEHLFATNLGRNPLMTRFTKGRVSEFLYRETGNPAIAAEMWRAIREGVAGPPGSGISGQYFRQEGLPAGLSLVARTDADRTPLGSWASFSATDQPAAFVVRKQDNQALSAHIQGRGVTVATVGPMPAMQQVSLHERQGATTIRLPLDTPDGDYLLTPERSDDAAIVTGRRVPLVVYAPSYWRPMPPVMQPDMAVYFHVPEEGPGRPALFFEGPTRLFDPQGNPWQEGNPQRGWITLPRSLPGLWRFEADRHFMVRARNLPPFFAFDDPEAWFEPDIDWDPEPDPEPVTQPAAEELFARGRGRAADDQALHLDGNRFLLVEAGPDHPSGDGGQFLPHHEGTVEFFLRPFWDTFDLFPDRYHTLLRFSTAGRPWHLRYGQTGQRFTGWQEHVFDAELWAKEGRTVCLRRALIEKGDWLHVALVWGQEPIGHARRGLRNMLTLRIYIDGRSGTHSRWMLRPNDVPADAPQWLEIGRAMPGLIDGLRISDIRRYTDDFDPPASDAALEADEHTRLLLRFDGDLTGVSYAWDAPLPEKAVRIEQATR